MPHQETQGFQGFILEAFLLFMLKVRLRGLGGRGLRHLVDSEEVRAATLAHVNCYLGIIIAG
jgi:hypothetical protein